jgi:hypothetical protein
MPNNLIVNYYIDSVEERQKELDFCLSKNLQNKYIDNVIVIMSLGVSKQFELKYAEHKDKIIPVIMEKRPSYNDYFFLLNKAFESKSNVNFISNLDIIIPEQTVIYSKFYLNHEKVCLALTRYDINSVQNYESNSTFFDRVDSQDTWIFQGGIDNIIGADFTLGVAGCDNGVAHLLESSGYELKNPSKTLKTYHYHLTNIRNYIDGVGRAIERVPPPYKLLPPTE